MPPETKWTLPKAKSDTSAWSIDLHGFLTPLLLTFALSAPSEEWPSTFSNFSKYNFSGFSVLPVMLFAKVSYFSVIKSNRSCTKIKNKLKKVFLNILTDTNSKLTKNKSENDVDFIDELFLWYDLLPGQLRSSPLQISDTLQASFVPAQNLRSGLVE